MHQDVLGDAIWPEPGVGLLKSSSGWVGPRRPKEFLCFSQGPSQPVSLHSSWPTGLMAWEFHVFCALLDEYTECSGEPCGDRLANYHHEMEIPVLCFDLSVELWEDNVLQSHGGVPGCVNQRCRMFVLSRPCGAARQSYGKAGSLRKPGERSLKRACNLHETG